MKKDWSDVERFRVAGTGPLSSNPGDRFGCFRIPRGSEGTIVCIVSEGCDPIPWEHVSLRVVTRNGQRLPTWQEMCLAKDLFWDDEEAVMQLHPPKSGYVNNHAYVLHLWRPTKEALPLPPGIAVGIKEMGTIVR